MPRYHIPSAAITPRQPRTPKSLSLWPKKKVPCFGRQSGMGNQGSLLALTGRASDAIEMLISGIAAFRTTGATLWMPFRFAALGPRPCGAGAIRGGLALHRRSDDGGGNNQGKVVRGGHPPNGRGNRADVARAGRGESGGAFRACHRHCPRAAGKVLGAARGDEHGSAVAAIRAGAARRTTGSRRSMAGSPKGSTRST